MSRGNRFFCPHGWEPDAGCPTCRAEEALEEYGVHLPRCSVWPDGKGPCSCGLRDVLEGK